MVSVLHMGSYAIRVRVRVRVRDRVSYLPVGFGQRAPYGVVRHQGGEARRPQREPEYGFVRVLGRGGVRVSSP